MSITSEINKLKTNLSNAYTSCQNKNATLPTNQNFDNLSNTIDSIDLGITPTGTINITENGTHDVTNYESANVSVDADVSDYFNFENTGYVANGSSSFINRLIKKIPKDVIFPSTNWQYLFCLCSSLEEIPDIDSTNVTNMSYTFSSCTSLTSIPQLDTSNVTNMSSMFYKCTSLTSIPQLDTSNVTNMSSMFYKCTSLTSIPQLNASKVTYVTATFPESSNLTTFGGLLNIGEAYSTGYSANYTNYIYSVGYCPSLTYESLMNVINGVYDIQSKGCQTQRLHLGSTNIAKLTAEEIALATNKGWSVV